MTDKSGQFVLAYNGELYNFNNLRKQLQHRWEFRTSGDTEVILAGLVLEGTDFLHKMDGMWALAFWDKISNSLLLTRDRMGKKPLYYQRVNEGIAVASELPALTKLRLSSFTEDLNSTADYLRHGYFLPGTTAYQGVSEVLPAHWLKWTPKDRVVEKSYWNLSIGGFKGSREDARNSVREKLIDATRKRLVADVEIGAFLSGGVDSSLIVSILSKQLGIQPKTFSMGFTEQAFDERRFARIMAKHCNTVHYEDCLDNWNQGDLTKLILEHIGQPFYDASLLPTSLVSELASRHVKVALSGDGGDELFGGYQRYQARAILRWYTRLPKFFRKGFETVVRYLPEPTTHHSRSLIKKAHLFLDIVDRMHAEQPYIAPVLYSHSEFKKLAPDLLFMGHPAPGLPEVTDMDSITEMMSSDALIYLPQDILVKVDRASMAHGLEIRAPFLDRDLVELAFSLPRKFHRHGLKGKRMLAESCQDLLPTSIWKRRKQGFGVPIHSWFRGKLAEELVGLIDEFQGPISISYVKEMLDIHKRGARDNGYRLWNIYIYMVFQQLRYSHSQAK